MTDLRQSQNYAFYMEKIGWRVERIDNDRAFIKNLPFGFSIIKVQRPEKISSPVLEEIDKIARNYRALFVKIEPQVLNFETLKLLNSKGYKLSRSPLLPTKTLQIDLTQSKDKIFSQFKKDARYEIRKAEKNHLRINVYKKSCCHSEAGGRRISQLVCATRIRETRLQRLMCTRLQRCSSFGQGICGQGSFANAQDDKYIEEFISLWHQNAWSRGFWIPLQKQIRSLYEAFGEDTYLITIWDDILRGDSREVPTDSSRPLASNNMLASAMIVVHDHTAYYVHAASSVEGRKLSAPYQVVWKAIKLAKSQGCRIFDFEGIYDERFPNKKWLGFTHFKKSFGGQEVEYPGCFSKFYHPLLKFLPL